jgi:hypothetical protein
LKKNLTIATHDSGGAEILSSWLKRNNCDAKVVAEGPAKKIFKSKLPNIKFFKLDDALSKSNWLLAGTGWETHFEKQAMYKALNLGIKTVAFLDHWVNYRERFEFNGNIIIPDEIWVGDKNAKNIANVTFPQIPVIFYPNPYFEDLKEEILFFKKEKNRSEKLKFLYVCEPIAEHALRQHGDERYWGYTEQDALKFFLENFTIFYNLIDSITIRPHPSENKNKYKWANKFLNLPIHFSEGKKLIDEIIASDIVAGCESMAMVVALLAKKKVISTIPPGGRSCQLPHGEIQSLQELIKSKDKYSD